MKLILLPFLTCFVVIITCKPTSNHFQTNDWIWVNSKIVSTTTPCSEEEEEKTTPATIIKNKCRSTQTLYKGKCFQVLQSLPCAKGEWLVENPQTEEGECVENKCFSDPTTGYYKGNCVSLQAEDACSTTKGMKPHLLKSGDVVCDCKEGFIFNRDDGNCYEAYRQGPCRSGEILNYVKYGNGGKKVQCVRNSCLIDGYVCKNGMVCNGNYYRLKNFWGIPYPKIPENCIKLGSPCTPSQKQLGIFTINPESNTPSCQTQTTTPPSRTRIIGNVPILTCAPGSRRDILGNCRAPTIIDFS